MLPIRIGTGLRTLVASLLFAEQAQASDDGGFVIVVPRGSNIVLCMGVVAFFITLAVLAWSTTHIFHVRALRWHAAVAPVEPVAPVDPAPLLSTEPMRGEAAAPEPETEIGNSSVPHCHFSKEVLARKAELQRLGNEQLREIVRAMGVYAGTSSTKDLMTLAIAAGSEVPAPDIARLVRKLGSRAVGRDTIPALSFVVVA